MNYENQAGSWRTCLEQMRTVLAHRGNDNHGIYLNKTTGLNENKFGINLENLGEFVSTALSLPNIDLCGLHYHIGSQIRDLEPFEQLCDKVNDTLAYIESLGAQITIIDVGGGLGINYDDPDSEPIVDFKKYFEIFARNIKRRPDQQLHFEPVPLKYTCLGMIWLRDFIMLAM